MRRSRCAVACGVLGVCGPADGSYGTLDCVIGPEARSTRWVHVGHEYRAALSSCSRLSICVTLARSRYTHTQIHTLDSRVYTAPNVGRYV
jgi:hypothetical protein